jgi:transcriptional regulator with XRE-family HTH domain
MTNKPKLDNMSMKAAMTYLRILREKMGLSQAEIARSIGVESKQVYRWEKCLSEPSSSSLATFTHIVGGSPEHVTQLILNENATVEDAEFLTKEILKEQSEVGKREVVTDSRSVVEAMELVFSLRHSPQRLALWVEQGKRLVEK